ncbi:uncharacterized protein LOC123369020 [Mauremys mutica]|uniref:uncharacterized protein LOC123369020 n=1 Tax=Mauremys mutica TaxID=74926 RepID=UPI001D169FCA|nr:uncharacterized protein LOC123369020 [Mauremys mutica]
MVQRRRHVQEQGNLDFSEGSAQAQRTLQSGEETEAGTCIQPVSIAGCYPLPCWKGIERHPFPATWVQRARRVKGGATPSICHSAPSDLEMERIRRMLRRKAGHGAPEPAANMRQPAQEESGPSVPAGGEEARGQRKGRSCFACWRRRKTAAPLADPEAPSGPKRKWPRVQLWSREPGEGRSRGRQLWRFHCRKPRSQDLRPRAQQEPPTTVAAEGPPAGPSLAPEETPAGPSLARAGVQ